MCLCDVCVCLCDVCLYDVCVSMMCVCLCDVCVSAMCVSMMCVCLCDVCVSAMCVPLQCVCPCDVCVSLMQLESGLDHLARAQGMDSVLDLYEAHAHGIMQTIKVTHTLTTCSVSHHNFPLTYSNP